MPHSASNLWSSSSLRNPRMLLTVWMLLCASLTTRTAFGRPHSLPFVAESSVETDAAAAAVADINDSYEQYNVAVVDENATDPSSSFDRMPLYQKPMDRAEFAKISEQAFLSLKSEDYVEKPFVSPEEKRWRWYKRNNRTGDDGAKLPGKGHKKLPGRRKALTIAASDILSKKQTCDGELFKQRVRMPGCLSKIVVNKFCHGQCASFFIPKLRAKKFKPAFQSCSACVPAEYDKVQVTLHCPTRNPPRLTRTVTKVKKCECRAVELD